MHPMQEPSTRTKYVNASAASLSSTAIAAGVSKSSLSAARTSDCRASRIEPETDHLSVGELDGCGLGVAEAEGAEVVRRVPREQMTDGGEVLERLGHLAAVDVQVAAVRKETDPLAAAAEARIALTTK